MKYRKFLTFLTIFLLSIFLSFRAYCQEKEWKSLLQGIKNSNYQQINIAVSKLKQEGKKKGYYWFSYYAEELLRRAEKKAVKKEFSDAKFFIDKALELSDRSHILFLSGILELKLNLKGGLYHLSKGFLKGLTDPYFVAQLFSKTAKPFLLTLTFLTYFAVAGVIVFQLKKISISLAKMLPLKIRGLVTPILLLLLIGFSSILGPLWALFIWALLIYFFIPEVKVLSVFCGAVLGIWVLVLPASLTFSKAVQSPMWNTSLAEFFNDFHPLSKRVLLSSNTHSFKSFKNFPLSSPLNFAKGILLLREQKLKEAKEVFTHLQQKNIPIYYLDFQLGNTAFLLKNFKEAEALYLKGLAEGGKRTPYVLINLSSIKFSRLKFNESELFLKEAVSKDKSLKNLSENTLFYSQEGLAPFYLMYSIILTPPPFVFKESSLVISRYMKGSSLFILAFLSLVVISLYLVFKSSGKYFLLKSYFKEYTMPKPLSFLWQLFPGVSFFLRKKFLLGAIICVAFSIILLPLLTALSLTNITISLSNPFWLAYSSLTLFFYLFFVVLPPFLKQEVSL